MTSDGTLSSGAIAAFLRGIERRAALFAHLQCGDAGVAQATVAATRAASDETLAALAGGRQYALAPTLAPLPIQFADYARWH